MGWPESTEKSSLHENVEPGSPPRASALPSKLSLPGYVCQCETARPQRVQAAGGVAQASGGKPKGGHHAGRAETRRGAQALALVALRMGQQRQCSWPKYPPTTTWTLTIEAAPVSQVAYQRRTRTHPLAGSSG